MKGHYDVVFWNKYLGTGIKGDGFTLKHGMESSRPFYIRTQKVLGSVRQK
jgi:hypothetical protein